MTPRPHRFSMEKLEARTMMAGDVLAYVADNSLFLEEAPGQGGQDNSVIVRQIGDDTIRVSGYLTADGTQSLINGAAYRDFTFQANRPADLNVNFGLGNDMVIVTGIHSTNQLVLNDISIDVGAADGRDKDSVFLTYVNTWSGSLFIDTGASDDWVYLYDVTIGNSGGGDGVIRTSHGSDRVDIYNSYFRNDVTIDTVGWWYQPDHDQVRMANVEIDGDLLEVNLGNGNDMFRLDNVDVHDPSGFGDVVVRAGNGNDSGTMRNVSAYSINALLGSGDDSLVLDRIWAKRTYLHAEGGNDSLSKSNLYVDEAFESGWEWINGWPAWWYGGLKTYPTTLKAAAMFG